MSHLTDQATALAQRAYTVCRALVAAAKFAEQLPEWGVLPPPKKLAFEAAMRGALEGLPVHEVWALTCGVQPDDATEVLYRQKAAHLKVIPTVFYELAQAVLASQPPPSLLDDGYDAPPEPEPPTEDIDISDDLVEEEEDPEV